MVQRLTLEEAKKHLIQQDGEMRINDEGLFSLGWYVAWNSGEDKVQLDGEFTVEDLEAIIVCMQEL